MNSQYFWIIHCVGTIEACLPASHSRHEITDPATTVLLLVTAAGHTEHHVDHSDDVTYMS